MLHGCNKRLARACNMCTRKLLRVQCILNGYIKYSISFEVENEVEKFAGGGVLKP